MGVDLAWSPRHRSGVAVVDLAGALLTSGCVGPDEELDGWLAQHAPRPITVAVDAPLLVPNPTGMRLCERQITAVFGRFDAGAYPSNRGRPLFDPPRAQALARRHGWSVDPDFRGTPARAVCVEVYPHPATIGLFKLGRTLKYKRGPVEDRRAALLTLCAHLEGASTLALHPHAGWATLRDRVRTARRPADLKRAEDEVDAVLCAHLAWRWHRRAGLQVYGDAESGAIVAPPPPDHSPSRRRSDPADSPDGEGPG